MSKVEIAYTVKSWKRAVGEKEKVDAEVAERLVANGQATYTSAAKQAEAAEAAQS